MTENLKQLIDRQADDIALWFHPATAPEAYIQAALRELHMAIEAELEGE